jgi:hypothetical protein
MIRLLGTGVGIQRVWRVILLLFLFLVVALEDQCRGKIKKLFQGKKNKD